MFCSLSNAGDEKDKGDLIDDVAEFQDLDAIYRDFDDLVNLSVLYKYQHVGPWYIITCPNAAEPFKDGDAPAARAHTHTQRCLHAKEQTYTHEVALLAHKMVLHAKRHGKHAHIGIHTGSAAGAVLGKVRAFYCVYGETVNLASQSVACEESSIRASKAFVTNFTQHARTHTHTRVDFISRGLTNVKGILESIETFELVFPLPSPETLSCPAILQNGEMSSWWGMNLNVTTNKKQTHLDMPFPRCRSDSFVLSGDLSSASLVDPLWALLAVQDLTAESRNILDMQICKGKKLFLSGFSELLQFHDAKSEDSYNAENMEVMRLHVGAGIILHLLGIFFQRNMVLHPE
eukprot:CAMPEP_0179426890 /NCGR_PEP_ID=MMETSP0799-20121207/13033_1 /TAXON_ID=46947 /ORGANISM="Geminigera cryophila, Strain CCMP2564" /LENGTH=345 /DNA_ID=CAMNT_0021201779 /DNA_START=519 /DNA_END=1554 /DNA_ORIENTATION=-